MLYPIIAAAIIGIIMFTVGQKIGRKQKKSQTKRPPNSDVLILGCCGAVDCGYWSPEYTEHANGQIDMNSSNCHCDYVNKWHKEGSECPFAKDHPNDLTPGPFDNM